MTNQRLFQQHEDLPLFTIPGEPAPTPGFQVRPRTYDTHATIMLTTRHPETRSLIPCGRANLPVRMDERGEFVALYEGKEFMVKGSVSTMYIIVTEPQR